MSSVQKSNSDAIIQAELLLLVQEKESKIESRESRESKQSILLNSWLKTIHDSLPAIFKLYAQEYETKRLDSMNILHMSRAMDKKRLEVAGMYNGLAGTGIGNITIPRGYTMNGTCVIAQIGLQKFLHLCAKLNVGIDGSVMQVAINLQQAATKVNKDFLSAQERLTIDCIFKETELYHELILKYNGRLLNRNLQEAKQRYLEIISSLDLPTIARSDNPLWAAVPKHVFTASNCNMPHLGITINSTETNMLHKNTIAEWRIENDKIHSSTGENSAIVQKSRVFFTEISNQTRNETRTSLFHRLWQDATELAKFISRASSRQPTANADKLLDDPFGIFNLFNAKAMDAYLAKFKQECLQLFKTFLSKSPTTNNSDGFISDKLVLIRGQIKVVNVRGCTPLAPLVDVMQSRVAPPPGYLERKSREIQGTRSSLNESEKEMEMDQKPSTVSGANGVQPHTVSGANGVQPHVELCNKAKDKYLFEEMTKWKIKQTKVLEFAKKYIPLLGPEHQDKFYPWLQFLDKTLALVPPSAMEKIEHANKNMDSDVRILQQRLIEQWQDKCQVWKDQAMQFLYDTLKNSNGEFIPYGQPDRKESMTGRQFESVLDKVISWIKSEFLSCQKGHQVIINNHVNTHAYLEQVSFFSGGKSRYREALYKFDLLCKKAYFCHHKGKGKGRTRFSPRSIEESKDGEFESRDEFDLESESDSDSDTSASMIGKKRRRQRQEQESKKKQKTETEIEIEIDPSELMGSTGWNPVLSLVSQNHPLGTLLLTIPCAIFSHASLIPILSDLDRCSAYIKTCNNILLNDKVSAPQYVKDAFKVVSTQFPPHVTLQDFLHWLTAATIWISWFSSIQ